jgi:hypothetical protein
VVCVLRFPVALLVATASLGTALTLGWPAAAAGHPVTSPTVVRSESPVGSDGELRAGVTVGHHYGEATCQSGSAVTGTAYRCFTPRSPQSLYDPCWASDRTDVVYCQSAPWQRTVTRLRVTGGFDNSAGFPHVARPWALQLESGPRCLPDVAAVRSVNGHRISYYCTNRTVLVGGIRRAASWHAHTYRSVGRAGHRRWKSLGWRPIRTAWRGVASLTAG